MMNNILPIYFQIKQTIKGWLINKEFIPGEKIPSENELAKRFKVSRLTVRRAIAQLIQEGFLFSKRGKGTFVKHDENLINRFNIEFVGIMDDLFYQQISKVKVKSAALSVIPATKAIKEKLRIRPEETQMMELKRVRYLKEQPFTYSINYLPVEIGRRIPEKDLLRKPLLQILEQELGIQFTEATQTIEASFANQEIAQNLMVANGSPILFVERVMYGKKHKPIELFQCYYRGDLLRYTMRFKNIRRRDGNKWIHRVK